ncbi:MAG: hypothetical protein KC503_38795 [Myxococcales bacterium]|nr:hypothetical protein [Myxococcales bacterium]
MRRVLAVSSILAAALLLSVGCGGLPSPEMKAPPKTFSGTWNTNWGTLELAQQRTGLVIGKFSGFRHGHVSGRVEGNRFVFTWSQREHGHRGKGYMLMTRDGDELDGRWGYGKNFDGGGRWWANRIE